LNEPNGGTDDEGNPAAKVLLDRLQLFLSDSDVEHGYDGMANTLGSATLIYDLDASEDNSLILQDRNSGSGSLDYLVYIKSSVFGSDPDKYVYLYSKFGTDPDAEGGFEEWANRDPATPTYALSGEKFCDLVPDGVKDADGADNLPNTADDEHGLEDWTIFLDEDDDDALDWVDADSDDAWDAGEGERWTKTDSTGAYSFDNLLADTTYHVREVLEDGWINTLGNPDVSPWNVDLGTADVDDVDFGNVQLGAGGGRTLGFWSNKNGMNTMFDGGSAVPELTMLNSLSLRDGSGNVVSFSLAGNGSTGYTQFRTWLLNATATNMAYMLSAQLAAMKLNVEAGFVDANAYIYVGTGSGIPGVNPYGFIQLSSIIAMAEAELASHGLTKSGSPFRGFQESLKNALDRANNNLNFATCL
jgi:hypothetical protein